MAQRRDKPGGAAEQGAAPQPEPSASQQLEMCREMMAQMDTGQTRKGMMGAGPAGPGMHLPMMHLMMRQMMGGETDPASIGMTEAMGAGNMDAKTMGRMLQMRGEMLNILRAAYAKLPAYQLPSYTLIPAGRTSPLDEGAVRGGPVDPGIDRVEVAGRNLLHRARIASRREVHDQ